MGDVGGVVDTEPDGDDDVGAGDGVDGEAPEVDEAPDVDEGENDAAQHQHRGRQVEQQQPGGGEHADRRQEDVPVQLLGYHLQCNGKWCYAFLTLSFIAY